MRHNIGHSNLQGHHGIFEPGKAQYSTPNFFDQLFLLKLMFSKKATKIDEIFTVDLMLCSKCQIGSEDLINFCGLLRKHEL